MADEDDFRSVSRKLDQTIKDQEEDSLRIKDIRERLFEPDDGLYSRIKDIQLWTEKYEIKVINISGMPGEFICSGCTVTGTNTTP